MPSLITKLASFTKSVKKSVQNVAKKLSFKKKNNKAIFTAEDKVRSRFFLPLFPFHARASNEVAIGTDHLFPFLPTSSSL